MRASGHLRRPRRVLARDGDRGRVHRPRGRAREVRKGDRHVLVLRRNLRSVLELAVLHNRADVVVVRRKLRLVPEDELGDDAVPYIVGA